MGDRFGAACAQACSTSNDCVPSQMCVTTPRGPRVCLPRSMEDIFVRDAGTAPAASVGGTSSTGTTTGGSPPDAGPRVNQAEWLWARHLLVDGQVKALKASYGDWVVGWLRAASQAAGSTTVVTAGTYTELANGSTTWSNTPGDRLVVHSASGYTGTLRGISVTGDLFDTGFPTGSADQLNVRWTDSWMDLTMNRADEDETYVGFYEDDDGVRRDVDVREYRFRNSAGDFEHRKVGSVRVRGETIEGNTTGYTIAAPGYGTFIGITYATAVTSAGVRWLLDGELDWDQGSYATYPKEWWSGTITRGGITVGGLAHRIINPGPVASLVSRDVFVGSDSFSTANVTVIPK